VKILNINHNSILFFESDLEKKICAKKEKYKNVKDETKNVCSLRDERKNLDPALIASP